MLFKWMGLFCIVLAGYTVGDLALRRKIAFRRLYGEIAAFLEQLQTMVQLQNRYFSDMLQAHAIGTYLLPGMDWSQDLPAQLLPSISSGPAGKLGAEQQALLASALTAAMELPRDEAAARLGNAAAVFHKEEQLLRQGEAEARRLCHSLGFYSGLGVAILLL